MIAVVEAAEHMARRYALQQLEREIDNLEVDKFCPKDLQELRIRAIRQDFDSCQANKLLHFHIQQIYP